MVYEIRFRIGFAVIVFTANGRFYLSSNGLSNNKNNAIVIARKDIDEIIINVTENSFYAYNDKIKNGFLTTSKGVRIGVCGECVFDNGKIITIKNISSINVRIPHNVISCSNKIFSYLYDRGNIYSSLIVSPPMFGKTTILKDLMANLDKIIDKSMLVIDERAEFSCVNGENIDFIRYSDKLYAFSVGLRTMSPYLIITDELVTKEDWLCVKRASDSGVKIIATLHSNCIEKVANNDYFIKNVFERYFVLDENSSPGVLKNVYDADFNKL